MSKKTKKRETGLVVRFTQKQRRLAEQISNDIAEDIDNGESREQLRMAVAYWADVAAVNAMERSSLKTQLLLAKANIHL